MKTIKITILLFSFAFFTVTAGVTYAATLTLDPVSTSIPEGETFDVKILIDTKDEDTTSVDAILNFNNEVLRVDNVINGATGQTPFFPDFFHNVNGNEIYIGAAVLESVDKRSGTGTVATITFSGIAEGVSDLIFDCTAGKTSDTNISKADKNATDIVECDLLSKGQYAVGTGIFPTPTSGPSPTPVGKGGPITTVTPTPTIQQVDITPGSAEVTMAITSIGVVLLIGGFGSNIILRFLRA